MTEQRFNMSERGLTLQEIAALTGATLSRGGNPDQRIRAVASAELAGPADLCLLDDRQAPAGLEAIRAGACMASAALADRVPPWVALLQVDDPYRAFVEVARALFPGALRPSSLYPATGAAGAFVHASARLENDVTIDPSAVVGPNAEIGSGTVVGPGAVVGPGVGLGRECAIGATTTVVNALVGDRVLIQAGCHIGQDGLAFVRDAKRLSQVPQLGRVIVQDEVRIGAGTAIDRGEIGDTIVGEGTKIDNLVQVGHNAVIGRHCVLAAQVGIAPGAILEDFVMLGPRVGVLARVVIGEGARVSAAGVVIDNVRAGAILEGAPATAVKGARLDGRS